MESGFPLSSAILLTTFGLLWVAFARWRRDPMIGKPIVVVRDSIGVKPALFAAQAALALIVSLTEDFPTKSALFALYGAFMLTWLSPGFRDRACGDSGVFYGWIARRYEDLDEWRLTGDHLRFKAGSEWHAVEVPAEQRTRVRSLLVQAAPDRESRFNA